VLLWSTAAPIASGPLEGVNRSGEAENAPVLVVPMVPVHEAALGVGAAAYQVGILDVQLVHVFE
jgi:hypothetical protein